MLLSKRQCQDFFSWSKWWFRGRLLLHAIQFCQALFDFSSLFYLQNLLLSCLSICLADYYEAKYPKDKHAGVEKQYTAANVYDINRSCSDEKETFLD